MIINDLQSMINCLSGCERSYFNVACIQKLEETISAFKENKQLLENRELSESKNKKDVK